jgi:hypothetical protein
MAIKVFSLAYANPNILEAGWRCFWATTKDEEYSSIAIGDAHYPLRYSEIDELITKVTRPDWGLKNARRFDLAVNQGLHKNYERLMASDDLADDDIVVLYDADEYPAQSGWLSAMRTAFEAKPEIGWLTLSTTLSDGNCDSVGYDVINAGGVIVKVPRAPVINHVCAFRVGALRKVGGLHEPREFYGYFEVDMWPKFQAAGYKMGCIADFRLAVNTLGLKHDATYNAYKAAHVGKSHDDFYRGSFEQWLTENK